MSVRVAGTSVSVRSNGVVRPLSPSVPVAAPPAVAAPAPVSHPAPEPAPAPASFLDFVQEHSRARTTSNSHGYVVLVLPVSETAGDSHSRAAPPSPLVPLRHRPHTMTEITSPTEAPFFTEILSNSTPNEDKKAGRIIFAHSNNYIITS